MAIETTRGLPSFSEMFNAFKSKSALADSINAGITGFEKGKAGVSKANKESAEAREANAHADYYHNQAAGGNKTVNLAALPDAMKAQLAPYADAQGNVPESTAKIALATTSQGQAADKAANDLAQRQAALDQQTKHQTEMAAVQQQLADLKASLGQSGQELNAAQTIANTTKGANPSLVESLVGKVGKAMDMPSIIPTDVTRADQNAAALDKLSGISKIPTQIPAADAGVSPSTADMIAPEPKRIFPAKGQAKGTESSPMPVKSKADYDKLPTGAWFVDSTGKPTQKKAR